MLRAGKISGWVIGALAMMAVLVAVVVGWSLMGSKPIELTLSTSPPPGNDVPPGMEEVFKPIDQFFVNYRLVGKLPGNQNDDFFVVVEQPGSGPYTRMLKAAEVTRGGTLGLAVKKGNIDYVVVVRKSFRGELSGTYSNRLRVKF